MKYFLKKQSKEKVSEAVLRAVSRLNKYEEQKGSRSIVWNGKSINYRSITS